MCRALRKKLTLLFYFVSADMCVMLSLYTLSSICIEFLGMGYAEVLTFLCALMIIVLTIFMLFAQDVDGNSKANDSDLLSVLKFTFLNSKAIAILHPMSVVYGFANIFFSVYINVYTVDKYLGDFAVGYTSAIQCAIAAIIPFSIMEAMFGRIAGLSLSSLAYVLLGGAYLIFTNKELGHWLIMIFLCAFYAIGRLSWLSSSRSIIAENFAEDEAVAFASFNLTYGLSSTLFCFIVSAGVTNCVILGVIVIVPALLMIPCYYVAQINKADASLHPFDERDHEL